ncbi:Decaprenyl diphosphate synthase-like protein, partial [Absidia repens]
WVEQAAIAILKKGTIPKHIGFILDGNSALLGKWVLQRLALVIARLETFGIGKVLGVLEITVYAFSIKNFKRSEDEVHYLMQPFWDTFMVFCDNNQFIKDNDIQVQFFGDLDCLPKDVANLARQLMEQTMGKQKVKEFNVCCPYTSRDGMTTSIKKNVQMIQGKSGVSCESIEQHLFTSTSSPLDYSFTDIRRNSAQ